MHRLTGDFEQRKKPRPARFHGAALSRFSVAALQRRNPGRCWVFGSSSLPLRTCACPVRFTVRTLYRNGEDDDDGGDEEGRAPRTPDIWTAFGDCGAETYLVYADSDEESDVVTTSSARLEVCVTGDVAAIKKRGRDHYSSRIPPPAPGMVALADDGVRRARRGTTSVAQLPAASVMWRGPPAARRSTGYP